MADTEYLQFGGQAVVEGVMMRSPNFVSVACRRPDGDIIVETEPLHRMMSSKSWVWKIPVLRGALGLIDSVALGGKAMRFASKAQLASEVSEGNKVQDAAIGGTLVFGLALGLILFVFAPNLIAEWTKHRFGITDYRSVNVITEIIKVVFIFAYLLGISRSAIFKEIFRYHGAEHKTINCIEAKQPLDVEHCAMQSRLHPRCGTGFVIIVLFISLIAFPFVPRYPLGTHHSEFINATIRFVLELVILPIVAGLAYEIIRLAGKFRNRRFVMTVLKPALWTQLLTTLEPDPKHLEVAIASLAAVQSSEQALASKPIAEALRPAVA